MIENVFQYRKHITEILHGKKSSLIICCGPCSIKDEGEAYEYADHLRSLQKEVGGGIFFVMRAFVEKSRTSHDWRGFVYQPDRDNQENITEGLQRTKELFSNLNLPICMEVIHPEIFSHLEEYLSMGFIGARTSSSSLHRELASRTSLPFGFKNSLDGCINTSVNAAHVANQQHHYLDDDAEIISPGNPNTFSVLRGSQSTSNYSEKYLSHAKSLQSMYGKTTPLMVDCSHGNARNKPNDQKTTFLHVLDQYLHDPKRVFAMMLESNIHAGKSACGKRYGVSATDPCISFAQTRELALLAAEKISFVKNHQLSLAN